MKLKYRIIRGLLTVISIGYVTSITILFCLPSGSAYAAESWFSGVRISPSELPTFLSSSARQNCAPGLTCFDVTVCLAGTSHKPTGNARNPYINIIKAWADAVYEQSNGKHVLGNVRIFPSSCATSTADVVWTNSVGTIQTSGVSGFGKTGSSIMMYTSTTGLNGKTLNFLSTSLQRLGGYYVGHEWAHYVYGLYDEYNHTDKCIDGPQSEDADVDSILGKFNLPSPNDSYVSLDDLKWLNHSTLKNSKTNTAQYRMFNKSGWEVLERDPKQDNFPVHCYTRYTRTKYSDLVAPRIAGEIRGVQLDLTLSDLNDPNRKSLSQLNISWMSNDLVVEIVIDKSASMSGEPLENAKLAASNLIEAIFDESTVGKKYVGVIAFDDNVQCYNSILSSCPEVVAPPQELTAESKTTLKTQIQNITSGNLTAFFDAAGSALKQIQSFEPLNLSSRINLVFLLSDGLDTFPSTLTKQDVIDRYKGSPPVPLNTFAYGIGLGSPDLLSLLTDLSEQTGGVSFKAPAAVPEITRAFFTVLAKQTSGVSLARNGVAAPHQLLSELQSITIDSTLDSFIVFTIFDGLSNDLTFSLYGPSGSILNPSFECNTASGTTTCSALIDSTTVKQQGVGTYHLFAANNTGADIFVQIDILGRPAPLSTYDLSVASLNGDTITFPKPMILTASVSRGESITGVNLIATITNPNGSVIPFTMNDAGANGDQVPGDGVYSAVYNYKDDGTYTLDVQINNNARTAHYTRNGGLIAPGSAVLPFPPITENFTRTAAMQVTVKGVSATGGDDHPNARPGTSIPSDNTRVPGSINYAGDVDFFEINDIDSSRDLAIRVTDLGLNMKPLLKVFNANGEELAAGDLSSSRSENGYVLLRISAAQLSPTIYASIQHEDVGTALGNYAISAGIPLSYEGIPVSIKVFPDVVNTKARGKLTVTILSHPGFIPSIVNQKTLTFGKTGFEESLTSCLHTDSKHFKWPDFNHDHVGDLVCFFNSQKIDLVRGDKKIILRGFTKKGEEIRGEHKVWVIH
jgi:calcium-activated chloride channel regulator 3/4